MFRLTKDGLTAKTDAQLRDLFQTTSRDLASSARCGAAFNTASAALRMIRDELARRGITPR